MKNLSRWFLILVLFSLLACSQESQKTTTKEKSVAHVKQVTKEERVARRAQERMTALIDMDWKKAYEFLSPARRKVLSYRSFAGRMGHSAIVRDAAKVRSVECADEVCDVKIDLVYTYVGGVVDALQGQQMDSVVEEKWVYMDGNWWYVMD